MRRQPYTLCLLLLVLKGHFGRTDLDLPWERTDEAGLLRQAAGIN